MGGKVCDHVVNIRSSFFLLLPVRFYGNLSCFYVFLMNILSSRICLRILTLKKIIFSSEKYRCFSLTEVFLFIHPPSFQFFSRVWQSFIALCGYWWTNMLEFSESLKVCFLHKPSCTRKGGDRVLDNWVGQWHEPAGFHVEKVYRKEPGGPGTLSVAKIRIEFFGLYDFGRHAFYFLSSLSA